MKTIDAIRYLQRALLKRFGKEESMSGAQIFVKRNSVDMTDTECTIVARGPVKVATVLRRKRRRK